MKSILLVAIVCVATAAGAFGQLFNDSALVSHPAAGAGGLDASAIEPPGTLFGWGCQVTAVNSMADDFTVPCGQTWNISDFQVFSYQSNSTTTPTHTFAGYKIYNGPPNAGGVVIHDHFALNQLTGAVFSNIYRVTAGTLTSAARPIMTLTLGGNGIVLPSGTYWIEYTLGGSAALSGPWVPPITIPGQQVTGNSLQNINGTWGAGLDGANAKGAPLVVNGTITPTNCYSYTILQPGGPGTALTFANLAGAPGTTAFTPLTGNAGLFPNDWFFGIAMDLLELSSQININAPPFVWTLDGLGNAVAPIGPIPVLGVTIYYVGLNLSGSTLLTADVAKSISL